MPSGRFNIHIAKSPGELLRILSFLALFTFLSSCGSEEDSIVEPQFYTSDIDLFWDVFDNIEGTYTSDIFESQYVEKGSRGLQDFSDERNLPASLEETLRATSYRIYYNSVRENTLNLTSAIKTTKKGFIKLREEFPKAQITDVYFLMGAMTAAGKISNSGLLIAVEMFSKEEGASVNGLSTWHNNVIREQEYLPSLVIHESIHIQQIFHSGNTNYRSALEKSIQEGMADYVSHYVLSDEPFMNEHLHSYGDPREEEIWNEFKEEMRQSVQSTEWLYSGKRTEKGHPADMGYYVGYKIVEAYAATFSSEAEAINAMLTTNDYLAIFKSSRYGEKFE